MLEGFQFSAVACTQFLAFGSLSGLHVSGELSMLAKELQIRILQQYNKQENDRFSFVDAELLHEVIVLQTHNGAFSMTGGYTSHLMSDAITRRVSFWMTSSLLGKG